MKTKIYVTVIMLVGLLIAIMISSAAWFSANNIVDTNTTVVTAADSLKMNITIPNDHINPDSYLGQTGTQYVGLDSPYRLNYFPVEMDVSMAGEQGLYMHCDISDVSIVSIIEGEPVEELDSQDILSNFTWRFGVAQRLMVFNPETGLYEEHLTEKVYRNNNGFLMSEEGQLFEIVDGASYYFNLYLYFLGEEGYSLMEETHADIPSSYAFAYSDISYMWATFFISINIGIKNLYEISFDSMGGSECEDIPTTGGHTVLLPTPTIADQTKYFGGWYRTSDFLGEQFVEDTLLTRPLRRDFTLYAKWENKPAVTFDANGWAGTLPSAQYVLPDEKATDPMTADIICWTTSPMTYAQYIANPQPFDFVNTGITQDITLYAVWRIKHTITLHMDTIYSGSLEVAGITYNSTYTFFVYDGETVPNIYFPEPDSGIYEFKKWSTNGSASSHFMASAYDFSTVIHTDLHLYAYYGI